MLCILACFHHLQGRTSARAVDENENGGLYEKKGEQYWRQELHQMPQIKGKNKPVVRIR